MDLEVVTDFIATAPTAQDNGYADTNDVQCLSCTRATAKDVSDIRRAAIAGSDIDVSAVVLQANKTSVLLSEQSAGLKKAFVEKTGVGETQILKVGEKVIITGKVGDKAKNGDRGVVKSVKDAGLKATIVVTVGSVDVRVPRMQENVFALSEGGALVDHKVLYFPIVPAKCITIARAQGMEILHGPYHVILEYVYQHGMILVALSRSNCLPSIDYRNRSISRHTLFADKLALDFVGECESDTRALQALVGE